MKLISAITIALMAVSSLFATRGYYNLTQDRQNTLEAESESDFEKAVQLIKKYETLHQPRHWPLVGYGHKVLPGEKFSRSKAMNEKDAEALLRKDLLKNCAVFRSFGADSLLLGVLAYNIGSGATLRSSVAKKLKAGNRNIYDSYVAHSRYRGKTHSQIKRRRIEEFETLFIKDTSKVMPINDDNGSPAAPAVSGSPEKIITRTSKCNGAFPTRNGNGRPITFTSNTQTACISRSQQYS